MRRFFCMHLQPLCIIGEAIMVCLSQKCLPAPLSFRKLVAGSETEGRSVRQYLLYLKAGEDSVQTHVTPCFAVDQLYWQEREGTLLYIVGKTTSLALAFAMREWIIGYLRERPRKHRMMPEELVAEIRREAARFVKEAGAEYGREAGERRPLDKDWFVWEQGEQNEAEGGGQPALFPGNSACANLASMRRALAGRALLWEELVTLSRLYGWPAGDLLPAVQMLVLSGQAQLRPGIRLAVRKGFLRHRLELVCERCGSSGRQAIQLSVCHTCGQGCAYCTVCLGMGRSKCCTPYLLVADSSGEDEKQLSSSRAVRLEWKGKYSAEQAQAAEKARRFVADKWARTPAFLIWAVCGAGKTELLFPAVVEALEQGGRVLIATPRKDVVMELAPRLKRAFPEERVIAVHGSSREKWEDARITIATTHQVMRFCRRFFLVVVDEVDAFPYHNDPVLYRAVERAVKPQGKRLYLSATPPRDLQRRLVYGQAGAGRRFSFQFGGLKLSSATHVLLPGRYHGRNLPVPRVCTVSGLYKRLNRQRPVPPLLAMVRQSLAADRQGFLFVPKIEQVQQLLAYMRAFFPEYAAMMEGVHAADDKREEKVLAFRQKTVRLMVTTTILERGVTIPGSDVAVVGAEAPVFDEASLVQIAGRVGRSADDPEGTVLFVQAYRAEAAKRAVRQIVRMNRLAEKLRRSAGRT